jgi:hypothetical protein
MGPSTQGKMIGTDLLNMLNYNSSANSQQMSYQPNQSLSEFDAYTQGF